MWKRRIGFEKEMVENNQINGLPKYGQLGSCKLLMIESCKAPDNWEIMMPPMVKSCKALDD